MVCLQTSFSDLKMIRVFTGKIQLGKSTCQCNNKIIRVARLFTSSSILKKALEYNVYHRCLCYFLIQATMA